MSGPRRRDRASGVEKPGLEGAAMYLDGYRKQILAWVREGLTDQEIADRVRVSRSTVRYWRERNGVARPPRGEGGRRRRPPDAGGRGA